MLKVQRTKELFCLPQHFVHFAKSKIGNGKNWEETVETPKKIV